MTKKKEKFTALVIYKQFLFVSTPMFNLILIPLFPHLPSQAVAYVATKDTIEYSLCSYEALQVIRLTQ